MSAILLVTCRICRRLHMPAQPDAFNPICLDCASKPKAPAHRSR